MPEIPSIIPARAVSLPPGLRGAPRSETGPTAAEQEQRAKEARSFLADVTEILFSSLDYHETLSTVAALSLRSLADGCIIDMAGDDGRLERLVVVNRDPARTRRFWELEHRYPSAETPMVANVIAFRTGEPRRYEVVTEELLRRASVDDGHMELWRTLDVRSALCVPLVARGRTLGVISLVSHDPARSYGPADQEVAEELAYRAAMAVDNALLYRVAAEARAVAEAASGAKTRFLATMSHELRTPLTAVLGYADLLLSGVSGELNPKQYEQIERIRAGGWHLLQLINQVLSLSRIEAGKEEVQAERVEPRLITKEAAILVEPTAAQKGLHLSIFAPDSLPPLHTDAGKLRQILVNLIGNAVKFTDEGEVEVRVVEARAADGSGTIRFVVRDTGPGIPAEAREAIFEPFSRLESSSAAGHGGTGLGLPVSRRLARLLGGDVVVSSDVGTGSTFTLELPL